MEVDHEPPAPPPPVLKVAHRARSSSQQRQSLPHAIPQRARSTSVQPRTFSTSRAGSVSDNERRIAESDAKKKLHEITRKYEDMRMKYDSLQELAQNAAETNFDKLKRATDEKTKDANNLISSLRREINELRKSSSTSASEAARLQSQVASLQTENEKAKEEAKASQTALSEAQNEVKSLTVKLDAARKSVQAPIEKVPGSAMKNQRDLGRSQVGGNPEATKHAALKEELYRDLTGLIITSVKRKDGEDEYSCIQTGRNGTLHFHLTISNDSSMTNPKTPSGLSYEDTEFAYEPLLDQNRDRDLIDILPDYLTEEICFPRNHAVKFYTKVVESMTRKIVIEDE
ncbi:chromosome segregation protein Csm1/Pcs1-domain-containing protein [Delphinella strobiligena]|nr:chromosome segregation protein Csm1/Pcs1-domain-containing protein [Delphinella strobiligena]